MEAQERYLENFDTKELVVLMCQMFSEKPKTFVDHLFNLAYIQDIQTELHEFRKISEETVSEWIERFVNGEL